MIDIVLNSVGYNTGPQQWVRKATWRYRGYPVVFGAGRALLGGVVTTTLDIETTGSVPSVVPPPLTTRVYGPVTRLLETGCGT